MMPLLIIHIIIATLLLLPLLIIDADIAIIFDIAIIDAIDINIRCH